MRATTITASTTRDGSKRSSGVSLPRHGQQVRERPLITRRGLATSPPARATGSCLFGPTSSRPLVSRHASPARSYRGQSGAARALLVVLARAAAQRAPRTDVYVVTDQIVPVLAFGARRDWVGRTVLGVSSIRSEPVARPAASPPATDDAQILTRHRMPSKTMRLATISGSRGFTAPGVLRARDGLQMVGVHTESVAAEMVELKAGRYWPNEIQVAEPMREDVALQPVVVTAITSTCPAPRPRPAAVILDRDPL